MNDGLSGVSLVAKSPAARERLRALDMDATQAALAALGEPVIDMEAAQPWISVRRDGKNLGMPTDRDHWPILMAWMRNAVELLDSIGQPRGEAGTDRDA
jgi:hypothetical protein